MPLVVASNVDLKESDLRTMDPQEVVAAAMGRAGAGSTAEAGTTPTDEAQEGAQRVWWYLLVRGAAPPRGRKHRGEPVDGVSCSTGCGRFSAVRPRRMRERAPMPFPLRRSEPPTDLVGIIHYVRRRWRYKLLMRGLVGLLGLGFTAFLLSAWGLESCDSVRARS